MASRRARLWYYGRRSPSDPDGCLAGRWRRVRRKDLAGVAAAIDVAFTRAGIADATFGDAWCGYRSLHVTYTDGSRLTERYDATTGHVVHEHRAAVIAADEAA